MASYPLTTFPATAASEKLSLMRRQSVMQSPWTLAQQSVNTASQWQLEFSWPRMSVAKAEEVRAWLDSLRGQVGTFLYHPKQSVASTVSAKQLVTPGYRYNNTIQIGGYANGAATQLRPGQLFQIGEQLLQITAVPIAADGLGRAVIEFEPSLRITFGVNTDVTFINPAGRFRLATSEGIGYTLDPDRFPTFPAIQCREAVE